MTQDDNLQSSTLTTKVAAVQIKMLHLQFRMKKIFDDQALLDEKRKSFKTNRETIKGMNNAAYTLIDMLTTMEHVYELMCNIFSTEELRRHFDKNMYQILNKTKKLAEKWKPVRNKLGGHLDMRMIEDMCIKHNYKGVFLSNDIEADLGVLNMLLMEGAVNAGRRTSDIFGRDLDFKLSLASEVKLLVDRINEDWKEIFDYFQPLMETLYLVGKAEKMAATRPEEWTGLVMGD